jgi:dTDP-4-dehydrorhamnose 3,5-epimerase
MHWFPSPLPGAYVLEPERKEDERGYFARVWCDQEAADHGLVIHWVQSNVSFNVHSGTLRGLHFQSQPFPEAKLVRCTRGSLFDVIVDLRGSSPTYAQWFAVELSQKNGRTLYIPKGFAHGFQTLEDSTEVSYQMSEVHHPEVARGIRWDDPRLKIAWPPCEERIISDRDRMLPSLRDTGAPFL